MLTRLFVLLSIIYFSYALPSFPGAEGFGAESVGGRGGKVIVVQNTNADGPGSLHEALTTKGKRIIVFRVGGTITFKKTMQVDEPFVTVLGQTAPGKGIALAVDGSEGGRVMAIQTNDVVFRHLRIRPGASDKPSCCRDGLMVYRGSNVVLDHISVSWSTDENIGCNDAQNITFSNSITSEALYDSNHEDDPSGNPGVVVPHSMGALFSLPSQLSIHHTMFARNVGRNPQLSGIAGTIDHRYNYVHQGTNTLQIGTPTEATSKCAPVNVVGNLVRETSPSRNGVLLTRNAGNKFCLYVEGNIGQDRPTPDLPEENFVGSSSQSADRIASEFRSSPHDAPPITRNPFGGSPDSMNDDVRQYVLKHAGCTKPMRDDDDLRLIDHVANDRDGKRVDSPPNGIVQLPAGTPRPDADKDGIPDHVESSFGLSSSTVDSHKIDPSTGYAFIELWANGKDLLGDEYIAPTTQSPAATTTKSPTTTAQTTTGSSPTPNTPSGDAFTFKWGSTPSSSFPELTCTAETGAKMTFQASYDDEGVHLDASVTGDSTPVTNEDDGGSLFKDDALEIIFDVAQTGTTILTPGAYKVIVSRAGKVLLAEAQSRIASPTTFVSAASSTASTSSGWSTKALIKWSAFASTMSAASLSAANAPNKEIRFHVRLVDSLAADNQQTCDSKPLTAANKINNPEQYATARFEPRETSSSTTTAKSSPTTSIGSSPSPTVTTLSVDLYETFTAAPESQCAQAPGTVGCVCVLTDERPCASSALVCVDLGSEARCARLRVAPTEPTEPAVISSALPFVVSHMSVLFFAMSLFLLIFN